MKKLSMNELARLSIDAYKTAPKHSITIILDNIRSMNNVGSIFRTADSFRCEQIILCGYTPRPPHREIHKTALGATESVDWHYYENIHDAITLLKKQEYTILGVEQVDNSLLLQDIDFSTFSKMAIILGNEVEGVSHDALLACDKIIEIPQFGTKHSLNVSIAGGIVLWEAVKSKIQ